MASISVHTAYDAIIIGGGHNGLVAAALLAQSGKRVLVLERRIRLGGAAATEEIFPGFKFNTGACDAGLLRPEIVQALELERHGLRLMKSHAAVFAPQPKGDALMLWREPSRNPAEIARFSTSDSEKYPAFMRLVHKLSQALHGMMLMTPPSLAQTNYEELLAWARAGLKIKGLGKREMMEFLRVLPMPVAEFLEEWFDHPGLQAALGAPGVTGSMQGPLAAGTAFMMLYHLLGEHNGGFRASSFVRGGMGELCRALASAAEEHGAEIRTAAEVDRILQRDDRVAGVVLKNGEEISGRAVISNADPRRTFFDLLGAPNLGVQFVRRVRNIRYRGATAKVNLALHGLPQFKGMTAGEAQLSGHILICPSLSYLERAYDEAKYGWYSTHPYLDIVIPTLLDAALAPAGQHVLSITMQYAPYLLKQSNWDEQRERFGDHLVDALSEYAPNLKDLILHRQVLTPLDWEREYFLTEGGEFHGQMGLDQLLFMRPVPGFGQYRTPIEGLYLCGAGTHPGGGVTGAPGHNAAREVIRDWNKL